VGTLDGYRGEDLSIGGPRASEVQGGGGVEGAYERSLSDGGRQGAGRLRFLLRAWVQHSRW
jgi:hypothetical protein